jgi:hypothetical protein
MPGKKIFYVPGLISLLGIPILFYLYRPADKPVQTVIKLFLPFDSIPDDRLLYFSKAYIYKCLENKRIETITFLEPKLVETDYINLKRFQLIESEIAKLVFLQDSNFVVKIPFTNNTSFGDVVYILNLATLYQIRRYAIMDDAVYLFSQSFRPIENPISTLTYL